MTGVSLHTVCTFIRHGQTEWNREGRYLSRTDLPLTSLGRQQAAAVARRLRRQPVTVVEHSNLEQSEQTARQIMAERAVKAPMEADHRWREADHGRWEGLSYAEVIARYPDEARARFADGWNVAPCGGETLADAMERVLAAWNMLLLRHNGGRIVVVTHATPIQWVICYLLGVPPIRYWQIRIDLGSLTSIDLYPSAAIIRTINETPRIARQTH